MLAAGSGSRFDPSGARYKLLQVLPGGEPVVAASARALLAAVPRVVAVVRPQDAATAGLLRGLGCEVVVCERAGEGMAASLVCGVQHARDADGWLIALADMPYVRPATMAALAHAVGRGGAQLGGKGPGEAVIAAPVHGGRRGNPVAFGRAHLQALLALQGDQGARSILTNNPVNELAVDDPGILQDIDTPSDIP
ncbi:NTP transferase domain-containing protein [Pseudoduganella sp.]|uniref:nucleotidyltransferase family protein n=1 Tax=Pseudoduganella sp. TaxID=1880898 RepID=UPI0035AFAE1B